MKGLRIQFEEMMARHHIAPFEGMLYDHVLMTYLLAVDHEIEELKKELREHSLPKRPETQEAVRDIARDFPCHDEGTRRGVRDLREAPEGEGPERGS